MIKVSYHKRSDKEGTIYDQAVSMKLSEMAHLKLAIDAEIAMDYPRVKEYDPEGKDHAKLFLKQLSFGRGATRLKQGEGVVFLNLTQRRFMELFLHGKVKEKIKDRNTCILIK